MQFETSPLLPSPNRLHGRAPENESIIDDVSNKSRKSTQYFAAVIATFGGFIAGTCLAWTSPVESSLKSGIFGYVVDDDEFGWISSFLPLGAIVGSILTATLADLLGRKSSLITLAVPCFLGWTIIAFSTNVEMACFGRLFTGIAAGSYCIVSPMYTAEIADKDIRGSLGSYFQFQMTIGILFTYVLGTIVDAFSLTLMCAVFPLLYVILLFSIPETPYLYVLKRQIPLAQESLVWLRGRSYDIRQEMTLMQRTVEDDEIDRVPFFEAFKTTPAKRGLLVGLGVMFLQQFSGCNAAIFYASAIFKAASTGSDDNADRSTIVVGVIQVFSTWLATLVIDKLGRRVLLLLSIVIMTLSTFLLGLYFFLKEQTYKDVSNMNWLPLFSLSSYIVAFSLGFGPIPWMLMAEIFPSKIRSAASSLACLFNWSCVFIVTKLFPIFKSHFGAGITFWCFTFCSGLGIFFVAFAVPETKGKTLLEVQQLLGETQDSRASINRFIDDEFNTETRVQSRVA